MRKDVLLFKCPAWNSANLWGLLHSGASRNDLASLDKQGHCERSEAIPKHYRI